MRTSLNQRYQSETELNSPTSMISYVINVFRIFSGFNNFSVPIIFIFGCYVTKSLLSICC